MDAASSPAMHDPQTCLCHPCQTARYQSQYGSAPAGPTQQQQQSAPFPPPPAAQFPPQAAQFPPQAGNAAGYAQQPGFPPPSTAPTAPQPGPPPGPQQPNYPPYPQQGPNPERTVAALAHWLPAAVAFFFSLIFGFFGLSIITVILVPVAPVIIYGTAKSPFVREHARESMNFQLTVLLPGLLFGILGLFTIAGAILSIVLFVICLIPQIMAAIKAGSGEGFRYPVRIPFVTA